MICAISSIPYYGLDYTTTLGFIQDDRILDEKSMRNFFFIVKHRIVTLFEIEVDMVVANVGNVELKISNI
jgi:hypothetical protein